VEFPEILYATADMVEFVGENQDGHGWIWHGCQRDWYK
jgi:hypothetical protein